MTETKPESPPSPTRIVEALLFVGGWPLTPERTREIVRNLQPDQFAKIIDDLNRDYRRQGRPYVVQTSDEGCTLTLKPQFRAVKERLAGSPREARMTPHALDVLSLVAYRQPVTRADIDDLRGTDSRNQLQQLVRLGLIAVTQTAEGEAAFSTTARFLELFGLTDLADLPRTGDLQLL
jgi:segregation and condensation protein B